MKKRLAFLGIAIVVSMLFLACKAHMSESEIQEKLRYRQFTSSNELVEGNSTAVKTISNYLNKEVTVGKDYPAPAMDGDRVFTNDNVCMRYEVSKYDQAYKILYLYMDDTHVVEAKSSDRTYVDGEKLSMDFTKNDGYNNEAYAWVYKGKATAVFDSNVCPTCTSIWALDEANNEVRLIWCDSFDCQIWYNYYNS
ncbi:MAG: hypothetical protein K6B70_00610 [Clostridia bacterium]|nr:hypothetical protein [Clostridia bacterium]